MAKEARGWAKHLKSNDQSYCSGVQIDHLKILLNISLTVVPIVLTQCLPVPQNSICCDAAGSTCDSVAASQQISLATRCRPASQQLHTCHPLLVPSSIQLA